MRRRFKNILGIIFFLLIICGAVFGYYFAYEKHKESTYVKVSGPLSINFASGNHVEVNGNKTVGISIINDSKEDAYYYIEFKNLVNVNDVRYKITDNEALNISDSLNPYNFIVSNYILIKAGSKEDFNIVFECEEDKIYSLDIEISTEDLEASTFADVILKNNEIKDSSVTAPGKEIATNDEGLIKSTDDLGTTYYFRGNVANNYVQINEKMFRIVRINGDGSVKLILDGAIKDLQKYSESDASYAYQKSDLDKYLNAWLIANLGEYATYVANQKYCNDITYTDEHFAAYNRIKTDIIPTFRCLGEKISNKVSLLTADEALYAGASVTDNNPYFYLYNESINAHSFLLTSASLTLSGYHPFVLTKDGKVDDNILGNSYNSIRPVITINKTALVSGNGTVNNPYIIDKNT